MKAKKVDTLTVLQPESPRDHLVLQQMAATGELDPCRPQDEADEKGQ